MMVSATGRECTENEYADLIERSGFQYTETHQADGIPMSVVEGIAS